MPQQITEDCIQCGICESECPNRGISFDGETYVIDAEQCTDCYGFHESPQCESVCPVAALEPIPGSMIEDANAMRAAILRPDAFPRD